MIPVGNSIALSVKSVATNGKNGALGWGLANSDLSSREMLTYAHIGAAGFHADKSASTPSGASGDVSAYDPSAGRSAFQDLLNANAAAQVASESNGVRNVANSRALANGADGQTGKKEPTWTVSMEGGRLQLSVNPNAR